MPLGIEGKTSPYIHGDQKISPKTFPHLVKLGPGRVLGKGLRVEVDYFLFLFLIRPKARRKVLIIGHLAGFCIIFR